MKRTILGIAILALAGAACQQAAVNTNSTNTTAHANHSTNANSATAMNHNGMNHSEMNHGSMNHSMMESSPNAATAPYDLQFLDTMIAHHQGAVDMAQMVSTKSQNADLKKFAVRIITDQNREIAQMREWREKWYAGKPAAINMEMPGMKDSMKMMMGDEMKKMEAATGKEFDLMFLDMMIPHHEGAVVMAKEALNKAEHAEIKTLAKQIVEAQESEIKQMQNWKTEWSK
jgi:uncharacterized protein (DUF305 family)